MLSWSDLRYALRLLLKSPRFTLLTIAVLGGGLGISIYTYSVLHTLLYKDLPIPDGRSMVRILGRRGAEPALVDAFELAGVRSRLQTLTDPGAYTTARAVFSDLDPGRSFKAVHVDWRVFAFTRTQPSKGRGFLAQDAATGAEAVAVVGYDVWESVLGGDPGAIGSVVRINTKPTRVVGVMPRSYAFPVSAEIWFPLSEEQLDPPGYSDLGLNAYARIRPGFSAVQVSAELNTRLRAVHEQFPRPSAGTDEAQPLSLSVSTFQLAQTGPEGPFVFGVLNVVALFILLLACVNVVNLLLARINERVKEIAVRLALGAPRARLVGQMALESVVLCLASGVVALGLTAWALKLTNGFLRASFEGDLPYWWSFGLDVDTLLAAGVFLLFTVALVAVLPTYGVTAVNVAALLKDESRGAQGRTTGRISRLLVVVEVVLIAVVMQVGSVMAIIAYRAAHVDFGMDTTRLVTMPVELSGGSYQAPAERRLFYDRLLTELRQAPQLEAAMLMQEAGETLFAVDGGQYDAGGHHPKAALVLVSDAPTQLGTRLLEGRSFDGRDSEAGLATALVSERLARTFWPDGSPLGRRVRLINEDGTEESRVVVGVVSNVKRGDLLSGKSDVLLSIYAPLSQSPVPAFNVLAKYRDTEAAARAALYGAIERVDPGLVGSRVMSYDAVLKKLTLVATTLTSLFIRCGLFAVLLAMTGIYGLASNAVLRRTREMSVRRAIGATEGSIIALFLGQACRELVAGLLLSAAISGVALYLVSRVAGLGSWLLALSGLLVAASISALVLVAVYIPTRRAVAVEPIVALRSE